MTTELFTKANFTYDSGYLHFTREDGTRVFIARFKYSAQKKRKPAFVKALIGTSVDQFLADAEATNPLQAALDRGMVLKADDPLARFAA